MFADVQAATLFPTPLTAYPAAETLFGTLAARLRTDPFNAAATAIFLLAIVHTFAAAWFVVAARRFQPEANERRGGGQPPRPACRRCIFGRSRSPGLWVVS